MIIGTNHGTVPAPVHLSGLVAMTSTIQGARVKNQEPSIETLQLKLVTATDSTKYYHKQCTLFYWNSYLYFCLYPLLGYIIFRLQFKTVLRIFYLLFIVKVYAILLVKINFILICLWQFENKFKLQFFLLSVI